MGPFRTAVLLALALSAAPGSLTSQVGPVQPGVITGRVVDEAGDPVVGAAVYAVKRLKQWDGPFFEVQTNSHDASDDRGVFRLHSLPPGDYTVAVRPVRSQPLEVEGRGEVLTYFPSATTLADAQVIAVSPSREVSVTIRLRSVQFVTLRGVVKTAADQPAARFQVSLQPRSQDGRSQPVGGAATGNDGTFSIPRVTTGAYMLTVTNGDRRNGQPLEIAETSLDVSEAPVGPLAISTARGATISGRLVWEGSGPTPWPRPAKSLGRMRAWLIGRRSDYGSPDIDVQPDGTFQFENMYGLRRIGSMGLVFNWVVKAVRGPQDLMVGQALRCVPGTTITDVEVVVTEPGMLRATVLDERKEPVPAGWVVLLPIDPTERDDGFNHRAVRGSVINSVTYYSIDAIVPGSYLAMAMDIEPSRLSEEEPMRRARAAATRIDVRAGLNAVTLTLVRLQEFASIPVPIR